MVYIGYLLWRTIYYILAVPFFFCKTLKRIATYWLYLFWGIIYLNNISKQLSLYSMCFAIFLNKYIYIYIMCTLYTCQMRVSKFRASFSSWHATSCPRDWYRHLSDICQRLPDDMSKVVSESVAITISRFTSELVKQCVRVYSSPEIRRSKCGNKCQNECCMKLPDKCLNIYIYI